MKQQKKSKKLRKIKVKNDALVLSKLSQYVDKPLKEVVVIQEKPLTAQFIFSHDVVEVVFENDNVLELAIGIWTPK